MAIAGYSGTPLANKLGFKERFQVYLKNPPTNYEGLVAPLPAGVKLRRRSLTPAGGRGMNLGIADAAELAQRFAEDRLEGYGASRHVIGKETIALSEQARRILTSRSKFTRATLGLAFAMINHLSPVQRVLARRFLGQ